MIDTDTDPDADADKILFPCPQHSCLIERYGSGIRRILDACEATDLPKPLFENFSGGFRIKFMLPVKSTATNSPPHVPINVPINKRIFDLIKEKSGVQRKEMASMLNVTEKTISRYVSELVLAKKIEHRGSRKTGGYYIVTKTNLLIQKAPNESIQ